MKTLRVILGDQLNLEISSLQDINRSHDVILMSEVWDEATYVRHHQKKIAFIFSAMRHFAELLESQGYTVRYIKLDSEGNTANFSGEVVRALNKLEIDRIIITEPSEWRVKEEVEQWTSNLDCRVEMRADNRFLCSHETFDAWAKDRKQLRMEYFYREMRKEHNCLMEGGKPTGGQWNFDSENRKPPKSGLKIPKPSSFKPDQITNDVLKLVECHFNEHFGKLHPFNFAVTCDQACQVLEDFIEERLPKFGDYQDAMIEGEVWMFHAHIGLYLNCGLLLPLECIRAAEQAYHDGHAPLNAVEGFIRQILGWREYVRGLYWLKMPDYQSMNFFSANRSLPTFYWSGETKMNCLKQCIQETREHAYAHHIQRLMILGNFALLTGIDPKEVNEWFMIVYADAYEWVELPNVTGMALFADGGELASKPYAAGGSYINRMSNYCNSCQYHVKDKAGENACPFNYLYWNFLSRNRPNLQGNHRLSMIYRTYDRMSDEQKNAIQSDSKAFLDALQ